MAENARNIPSRLQVLMQFYAQLNIPSSASTSHIFGAFSSFISRQFSEIFSILGCYLFHFTRLQFIIFFNQSIAFIIPVLTAFLQLKYQGINDQNKNPFATHRRTMRLAVSSCVVYYVAFIALLRFPLHRYAIAAQHCLVLSGFVSVASLASVFLPDFVCPYVYAVFVLLSATELLYRLYRKVVAEDDDAEFQVHRRRVRRFLNNICRALGNSSGYWLPGLPI